MTTLLEMKKVRMGGQALIKLIEPYSKIHAKLKSVINQHVIKSHPP